MADRLAPVEAAPIGITDRKRAELVLTPARWSSMLHSVSMRGRRLRVATHRASSCFGTNLHARTAQASSMRK